MLFLVILGSWSHAEPRLALVIDNSRYGTELGALTNPGRDANRIEAALKQVGFEVTRRSDLAREPMKRALSDFASELSNRRGAVGFVYYAGHGASNAERGENFLLPVDAAPKSIAALPLEAVSLNESVDALEAAQTRSLIVVIDACRNVPALSRSGHRGLVAVSPSGFGESLIAYATSPGKLASDDGLFARVLAAELVKPGATSLTVFESVKQQVARATQRDQVPRIDNGLIDPVVFVAGQPQPLPTPDPVPQPDPIPKPNPVAGDMVRIPGGSFRMGCVNDDGCESDEKPARTVTVKPFYLARTEVTVGQFRRFVSETGYATDAERNAGGVSGCAVWSGSDWEWTAGRSWKSPGFPQGEDHPVVCVSWSDAVAYVDWMRDSTGQSYRLPTEAEFEYANRAGSSTKFPWGASEVLACKYGNVADSRSKAEFNWSATFGCDDGYVYTAPVRRYAANGYGVHDLAGNVWEWVQDEYHDSYAGAPTDGSAWVDGGDGSRRVLRGGSWGFIPDWLRSASRDRDEAAVRSLDSGFRLAQDAP